MLKNKKQKDNRLRYCKIPESVNVDNYFNSVVNLETLHSKIEPLISTQTFLTDSVAELTKIIEPTKESMVQIGNIVNPLTGSMQVLGSSLAEVSKIALKTDDLLKVPTYDFVNSPVAATLNVAVDAIKINQNKIESIFPYTQDVYDPSKMSVSNQISQISALNSIAIKSLESSNVLFPVPEIKENISDISEKVAKLELKINQLRDKNENIVLTNITSDIIKILKELDDDITDWFKGAMRNLIEAKNEDLVGQVAESLTRVIEKLPLILSKKQVFLSTNKEDNAIEALSFYFGTPKEKYKNNHLIMQQKSYYAILGNIRHRKSCAYKFYNRNKKLFKAFVVQVEAYIYILLTFKNAK